MMHRLATFYVMLVASPVLAQTAPPPVPLVKETEAWPETWFEIFRLAPGQHEAFVRRIAMADEVSRAGGQPPLRLYFHQHGADWDVLILKVEGEQQPTSEQQAAMDAKARELGMPSGPAYYADLRETIASHTDTKTTGPISAAQWLARLDAWRAEQAKRKH